MDPTRPARPSARLGETVLPTQIVGGQPLVSAPAKGVAQTHVVCPSQPPFLGDAAVRLALSQLALGLEGKDEDVAACQNDANPAAGSPTRATQDSSTLCRPALPARGRARPAAHVSPRPRRRTDRYPCLSDASFKSLTVILRSSLRRHRQASTTRVPRERGPPPGASKKHPGSPPSGKGWLCPRGFFHRRPSALHVRSPVPRRPQVPCGDP